MKLPRPPTTSLRRRLLLAQTLVFMASLVAFAITYLAFKQGDMRYHVVDDLYQLSNRLGHAIVVDPAGRARLLDTRPTFGTTSMNIPAPCSAP